ncbi:MAG: flavodoxin family protein [Chloroflexi bacterium]|nr:flavodoxin family protein [Chloroflexota bacterium]
MKKVTAFVGSAHKKNTHAAVAQYLDNLQALGEIEVEIVTLSNYKLGTCRGCRLCFEKGEQFCPLKDDRDVLMDKIMASDGVILATPNYSFQVSGLMKNFLDHFGFVFHRPCYFGKAFTSIVTQGIGGGDQIVKYLDFVGSNLGFNTLKGIKITALDPRTERDQARIDRALAAHSRQFYARLARPAYPAPSVFKLMLFRVGRTTMYRLLDDSSCDYRYYAGQGWFQSDYYYPTRLGVLKRAAGSLFDAMAPAVLRVLS